MNEDRITGQRAGIRWAIARIRRQASDASDPGAKDILNAVARLLDVEARTLRNEDADDITAGLEALKESIVAEWGEVKDRLNLGKED